MPTNDYLQGFLKYCKSFLDKGTIETLTSKARGYAGGKSRVRSEIPTVIEKLTVGRMTPSTLREQSDEEIKQAWYRLNQLWGGMRKRKEPENEMFLNAGIFVLEELTRRKFKVDDKGDFYKSIHEFIRRAKRHRIRAAYSTIPEKEGLIEDFVSVGGSMAMQDKEPEDIDIIIRAEKTEDEKYYKIKCDLVDIAIRNALDRDKSNDLHYIASAQGSFTDHNPIFQLALVRYPQFETHIMKKDVQVPAFGPKNAPILFVGSSPGRIEANEGRPFWGQIKTTIENEYAKPLGIPKEDIAKVNAVPQYLEDSAGRTREPTVEELAKWREWLYEQIDTLSPTAVVALGDKAAEALGKRADFKLIHPAAFKRYGKPKDFDSEIEKIKNHLKLQRTDHLSKFDYLEGFYAKTANGINHLITLKTLIKPKDEYYNEIEKIQKSESIYENDLLILEKNGYEIKKEEGLTSHPKLGEEGGTRSEIAAQHWLKNWAIKTLPQKSNIGRFAAQHHWRGLDENQTKWSDKKLWEDKKHSVHTDIRMEADKNHLWGITVFMGADRLEKYNGHAVAELPYDDALQISFKLSQPLPWIEVGEKKPMIIPPGEVAASKYKWSVFHGEDFGDYEITYAKEHFIELFFSGKHIKGRYILQFAPVGERSIWILKRAKQDDQEPFLMSNKLENEVRDQQQKNRRWLWYAKDGKPIIIDLKKVKPEDFKEEDNKRLKKDDNDTEKIIKQLNAGFSKEENARIYKINEPKQIIYSVVLPVNSPMSDAAHDGIDYANPEEVEKACHKYMEDYRKVGELHKKEINAVPVENWIEKNGFIMNGQKINKGDWCAGLKIRDSEAWKKCASGEYNAVSVEGYSKVEKI